MTPITRRCHRRWYPLKDHPIQMQLIQDKVRFKLVPAGRRSGKTERAKRHIAKLAMTNDNEIYFLGAPTRDQAKKIWWNDIKLLTYSHLHPKKPSESNLIIFMPNGSEIHVVGLDVAARIEGQFWSGGVIDEIGNVKDESWALNVRPALDTFNPERPDYRAWCWLIGVPEGYGNDFAELHEYAQTHDDPDWKVYTWFSADILPPDMIEAAKRSMSKRQYQQEYEAKFSMPSDVIYEDYSEANHTKRTIQPHERLHWMHDQNFTPLSSSIGVVEEDDVYLLDEIVLTSAVSRQSAEEFVNRYENHQNKKVYIYGDPAGRAGEKHGHASDYTEMESVLKKHGWDFERRVKKAHPSIKDRQNSVRAKILNALGEVSLYVNPLTAEWTHKGLETVQLKKGSSFLEDQSNDYQHITTAVGYFTDYLWPVADSPVDDFNLEFT